MITFVQAVMGIVLILQGLFLWFVLAFNGSVGATFVNYSLFISALLMIIAGGLKISKIQKNLTNFFCLTALILYLPMIWQRFQFSRGAEIDVGVLYFDIGVIVILLISLSRLPKEMKK